MCIGYGRVLRSAPAYPTCNDGGTAFGNDVTTTSGGSCGNITHTISRNRWNKEVHYYRDAGCGCATVLVRPCHRIDSCR